MSKVNYTGLDLSTSGGLNTLKSRLEKAHACFVQTRASFAPRMALLPDRRLRRG